MLAGIFIYGGIGALRDPEGHEKAARPVLDQFTRTVPVPENVSYQTLVKLDAGVKIGAGSMLALGTMPRLAAAALSASLVPTTLAQHRFWELDDPDRRVAEQIHFLKNMGLLGGLMLAAADTGGKPSLSWRARRVDGRRLLRPPAERVERLAEKVGRAGERAAGAASHSGERASDLVERASERVTDRTARLRAEAEGMTRRAAKRTRKTAKRARKRARAQAAQVSKRADRLAATVRSTVGS
ncbi:DoxX family membrane protein [Pseudonocardia acaciae]|uniref:DoxX family membrane protein n=1 Tax=Pseudonocardia acaciae TaxID=551276 RepID=UPI0007E8C0D8